MRGNCCVRTMPALFSRITTSSNVLFVSFRWSHHLPQPHCRLFQTIKFDAQHRENRSRRFYLCTVACNRCAQRLQKLTEMLQFCLISSAQQLHRMSGSKNSLIISFTRLDDRIHNRWLISICSCYRRRHMGCLYMHQKVRSFLIISINATFAIISSFLFLWLF